MGKYTVNSFFSGIGGFDLAFERQGFEVKYQCEINDFCKLILNRHWPKVPCDSDITKVQLSDLPTANVWCAGFPCQDVSVARGSNGRQGLKGKNSGLFYDFFNLIEKKQPEVILLENVLGLLSSHEGNDFKIILQYLNNAGYGVSWRVFNSKFFGVPQSRPRVYICAWKNDINKAAFVLHEFSESKKNDKARLQFINPQTNDEIGFTVPELAYCLAATSGRHTGTDWSRTYVCYENRVRRLIPTESESLQGFPLNWTLPNDPTENSLYDFDSLRYHAIGNAVSVPVIEWIAKRVKKVLATQSENLQIVDVLEKYGDFKKNKPRNQSVKSEDHCKIKWNTGGIALAGEAYDCKVFESCNQSVKSNLIDFISNSYPPEKYFISAGAARGILRRADNQNRKLFTPLRRSLERLSELDLVQAI